MWKPFLVLRLDKNRHHEGYHWWPLGCIITYRSCPIGLPCHKPSAAFYLAAASTCNRTIKKEKQKTKNPVLEDFTCIRPQSKACITVTLKTVWKYRFIKMESAFLRSIVDEGSWTADKDLDLNRREIYDLDPINFRLPHNRKKETENIKCSMKSGS